VIFRLARNYRTFNFDCEILERSGKRSEDSCRKIQPLIIIMNEFPKRNEDHESLTFGFGDRMTFDLNYVDGFFLIDIRDWMSRDRTGQVSCAAQAIIWISKTSSTTENVR